MTTPTPDPTPASRPIRPADLARGAYKGRGRDYLALLVCPVDGASLQPGEHGLACAADSAHLFPIEAGIVRLVDPARRAEFDRLSAEYDSACAARGWPVPEEDAFKSLPQTGLSGYPLGYWASRADQTALFWRYLEAARMRGGDLPVGPRGGAAVLGAGLGWLAYALDVAGYTTLALDARTGPRGGLGAYGFARYLRVQADPGHPPLAPARFELVVIQDVPDAVIESALAGAVAALHPGGWLAVLDDGVPGRAAALRDSVLAQGLAVLDLPPRHTWRDRLRERWDRRNGRGPDLLSVLVAQVPGGESSPEVNLP